MSIIVKRFYDSRSQHYFVMQTLPDCLGVIGIPDEFVILRPYEVPKVHSDKIFNALDEGSNYWYLGVVDLYLGDDCSYYNVEYSDDDTLLGWKYAVVIDIEDEYKALMLKLIMS